MTVWPSSAARPPVAADLPASMPCSSSSVALPSATYVPSTFPHAFAGDRLEPPPWPTPCLAPWRPHNSLSQRMFASLFKAGGQPQRFSFLETAEPVYSEPLGLPSVRVPVLSTTRVSIFSMISSASAFLISTPAMRPAPDPHHDGHGCGQTQRARAGNDQHGHGVDDGMGKRGSGPKTHPAAKVTTAIGTRREQNIPPPHRPASESAPGCAGLRQPSARCGQASVSEPTFSARIRKLPVR